MHIFLSWDISTTEEDWEDLNGQLRACFEEYSWVKPLTTMYLVQINDALDRESIRNSLLSVCKRNPGKIHFLLSPVLNGGGYSGWLPKNLWSEIKKRTAEADQ